MFSKINKRIVMIERGLHRIYHPIYNIINEEFELEIISENGQPDIKGINIIKFDRINFLKKGWVSYKGLWSYLKKENFDIIMVRPFYRPYSFLALIFSIIYNKKLFFSEEQRNEPHRIIDSVIFNLLLFFIRPLVNLKISKLICLTRPCYDYLSKKGFKKLIYIPISYELKKWPKKIDNKQDKIKIINVARFEWLKAHHILIKAVAYLIKTKKIDKKEISVDLIGEGSLMNKMKKLCKKFEVDDIINFKGTMPNEKLGRFYQKHNLFILSSISDPIGLVVFEAMANGLPIIVSSNTGAKGSVYNWKNGFIFEAEDYKDLAKKILIMKNPSIRQKFGEESLRIIKKENNFEIIKQKYKKILN